MGDSVHMFHALVLAGGLSTEMDTLFTFWEVHANPDNNASDATASTSSGTRATTADVRVHSSKEFRMNGYGFVHDFALTANYYILFQPPVYTDVGPYAMGKVREARLRSVHTNDWLYVACMC